MMRPRSLPWLPAAAGLCALVAGGLCLRGPSGDSRRKGVAAAVLRTFGDERRAGTKTASTPAEDGLPVSPLRKQLLALRKEGKAGAAVTFMDILATEPDEEKWTDGLYQMLILNHQDPRWGGILWSGWMAGLNRLPAATLYTRVDHLPGYLVNQWEEARVSGGRQGERRALAELVRTLHRRMAEEGIVPDGQPIVMEEAPDTLKDLMTAAVLGDATVAAMEVTNDFEFTRDSFLYNRLTELDILDRLRTEPDMFLEYALHGVRHLAPDDPDLRAATGRETFFFGPENRLQTVLAAPPSDARDALLASAAALRTGGEETRSRILEAISDEAFRTRESTSARQATQDKPPENTGDAAQAVEH